MPLAVETPHTLFNALQTAAGELDIQVYTLEGDLPSKLGSDAHTGAEGTSGLGCPGGSGEGLLVEVFATRVRKGRI
jgi:hypothetical protein